MEGKKQDRQNTVCPRSSDPFYLVTYFIKWVTTSWTNSIMLSEFKACLAIISIM